MTEPPSSSTTTSPWSVSGDEAAELMRLHRELRTDIEDILMSRLWASLRVPPGVC